ncbi:toxin-antitoxin system YwqK family antitoxin [Saccharicrinis aurantiacus]|uniref:toxin-antitoxin system YwqK family antitoxin n=1 Tax=Saccharicrinis aurantiacus TaxID=1849719 RepID=UPI000838ACEE|nr:hypothetical protein [Saccharicrinis aurantiacus]
MKLCVFLLLHLCCSLVLLSQKKFIPEYNDGSKIFIVAGDSLIQISVIRNTDDIKLYPNRFYHYYKNNNIHKAKGGYIGKLLDSQYLLSTRNGQLIERGNYKKGLKHGEWVKWHINGELSSVCTWKKGKGKGKQYNYNINAELLSIYKWSKGNWILTRKYRLNLKRENKRIAKERKRQAKNQERTLKKEQKKNISSGTSKFQLFRNKKKNDSKEIVPFNTNTTNKAKRKSKKDQKKLNENTNKIGLLFKRKLKDEKEEK